MHRTHCSRVSITPTRTDIIITAGDAGRRTLTIKDIDNHVDTLLYRSFLSMHSLRYKIFTSCSSFSETSEDNLGNFIAASTAYQNIYERQRHTAHNLE